MTWLSPKRPRNLLATGVTAGVFLLSFLIAVWLRPWSPKEGLGLVFGFVGAFLFGFEMVYPMRRPSAWPLRGARQWVQAHIYLGLLAALAVILHMGFVLPRGGLMGWGLFLLTLWVSLSGVAGVLLQKWIPATLARNTRVEALFERIPALVEGLRDEADVLMADASDTLENFYQTQIRSALGTPNPAWGYLFDVREGRERALEPFRRIAPFVDAAEKVLVDDLMHIYTEKLELDAQYRMQWVLRNWLPVTVHALAGGLLIGLLTVHVLSWVLY